MPVNRLTRSIASRLDRTRIGLGRANALLPLSALGIVTGLATGAVIILFRLLVETSQAGLLPGQSAENYEGLGWEWRLSLPVIGALVLAVLFWRFSKGMHMLGVAQVIERMAYHQGYLTLRGFLLQFVGAAVAIVSGHSVGREGPHVYLGAASGSLLGQWLTLPNNSIRTLAGCGAAAGIAASFNTPLAGVIFSLEVVMLEYSVASFIPVILAAATATLLSQAVFGAEPAFLLPSLEFKALSDLPAVGLLGLVAGGTAAIFIASLQGTAKLGRALPIGWRVCIAGLLVGLVGVWVPEVMGIGYDTLNQLLAGQLVGTALLLLLIAKILATTASIGLGVPGGLIGPSLFIGAVLGAIVGYLGDALGAGAGMGFFVLLGMAAMMGASLQAPLAALTAIVELTQDASMVMPGMLVVVVAALTTSELFGKESVFLTQIRSGDRSFRHSPVIQALRRIGVSGVMSDRFVRAPSRVPRAEASKLLAGEPAWLLTESETGQVALLRAADLARALAAPPGPDTGEAAANADIDLMSLPAERLQAASIHLQATLEEAQARLLETSAEALYVERGIAAGQRRIYGILTPDMIESAYR